VWGTGESVRWVVLAGVPATIAFASATPWGSQVLVWLVSTIPGAGLLRDSQKLLAPATVLVAAAFGAAVARACGAVRSSEVRPLVALVLVLAPVLLLPDATTETWPTVTPVRFPDDLQRAADRLAGEEGAVVTLPWRAYRAFDWTRPGQTASDPAIRMIDADVVTSDSLQVGDVVVPGESTFAAEIGSALEDGSPAEVLARLGVAWVLLYPDDSDAAQVETAGLAPLVRSPSVELYRVPGAVVSDARDDDRRALMVWSAHALAMLVALAAVATRIFTSRDRDADPPLM
jgi:hypothetical protein